MADTEVPRAVEGGGERVLKVFPRRKIAVLLKGYPRLSETFIAQELLSLERAGLDLVLISMRRPTDAKRHPVHQEIKAPVRYLPEYLHEEPLRVFLSLIKAMKFPGFWRALRAFGQNFFDDPTRNSVRRLGQAAVLAAEWPHEAEWLHAHFIHTPASVALYASLITGVPWSCSAHAKDIWTTREKELAKKIASARWVVTCTKAGLQRLANLADNRAKVTLSYHGLDLDRFGEASGRKSHRDGLKANDPVVILSVGRLVEKKGYDILLEALAMIPQGLAWRFVHVGGEGEEGRRVKALAASLGLSDRISWEGPHAQEEVLLRYREADLFALACRIGKDGDRDGLPNVLLEASSQGLACLSTNVSGVTELLTHDVNGIVVEPDRPDLFAKALTHAITDPAYRARLGAAAQNSVRQHFDHRTNIKQLIELFKSQRRSGR
jgi:glycosyltransferase involved in cell wall biosynthesis